MKLSPAQIQTLADVIEKESFGGYTCISTYKPALKLVQLGLVSSESLRQSSHIKLKGTPAGREELKRLLGHDMSTVAAESQLSVRERLSLGHYANPIPFPPATDKEARRVWREGLTRLHRQVFRDDALKEVGLDQHPKAQAIWDKAWESHHSHSLLEVLQELEELAELFR